MWLIFLFLFFIFGATNSLMRRVLAQKFADRNKLLNGVAYVFFLLPGGIILSFFFPHDFDIGIANLLLLACGAIMWPLVHMFAFRANKTVDAGVYTIIANLSPLFTLVIAVPFLGEQLSLAQYLGIALLIVSSVIAVSPGIKKKDRVPIYGVLFALLSVGLLGVGIAFERFMLNRIDLGTYFALGWGFQVAWMALLAANEWKYLPQLMKKVGAPTLLAWGSANVLRAVSFIMALFLSGSASLMSGATNFISVFIVIAAFFILHERDHMWQKIIATLIGIFGLFLIAF